MAYIKRTTRTDETVEVEYFYTAGKHNSAATRKQAVERLRRLVNTNFNELSASRRTKLIIISGLEFVIIKTKRRKYRECKGNSLYIRITKRVFNSFHI